jgi:hypothetical protein
MKKLLAVLAIAMMCTAAFANPPRHDSAPMTGHDGTWWHSKGEPYRDGFLNGYRSGIARTNGTGKSDYASIKNEQIIQGLDSFYKDFRNINVQVEDAMGYVKDELSGKSDADLAAELQTLRKNAAAAQAASQAVKGDN